MSYVTWDQFQARSNWHQNQNFYGKAYQIKRSLIIAIITIICILTPFTNWLIPLIGKIIKTGITLRWG